MPEFLPLDHIVVVRVFLCKCLIDHHGRDPKANQKRCELQPQGFNTCSPTIAGHLVSADHLIPIGVDIVEEAPEGIGVGVEGAGQWDDVGVD